MSQLSISVSILNLLELQCKKSQLPTVTEKGYLEYDLMVPYVYVTLHVTGNHKSNIRSLFLDSITGLRYSQCALDILSPPPIIMPGGRPRMTTALPIITPGRHGTLLLKAGRCIHMAGHPLFLRIGGSRLQTQGDR